jgi:hypothetical protein
MKIIDDHFKKKAEILAKAKRQPLRFKAECVIGDEPLEVEEEE